jgi:hypothetical protein
MGSTSRKVAQPLVRHIGRSVVAARRRIRRIELARPTTDVVVVRDIMLVSSIPSAHGRGLGAGANVLRSTRS